MQDTWFKISRVVGVVIFLIGFSSMGYATGGVKGMLGYAVFCLIVLFGIMIGVKKNQRHFEAVSTTNYTVRKISGLVLALVGVVFPAVAVTGGGIMDMGSAKVGFGTFALVLLITLVWVAIGTQAVKMLCKDNATKMNKILGYVIAIVLSTVPAIAVIPFDRTTSAIGTIYFVTMMTVVFAWWGITLYLNKE